MLKDLVQHIDHGLDEFAKYFPDNLNDEQVTLLKGRYK